MIYNISKLDDEDRKFLIGYLDSLRSKLIVRTELQNKYYDALKKRLNVTEKISYVSLDHFRDENSKHHSSIEFIVEYLFLGEKPVGKVIDELGNFESSSRSEVTKANNKIEEILANTYNPELLIYQYVKGLSYLADPILRYGMLSRRIELLEALNDLKKQERDIMTSIERGERSNVNRMELLEKIRESRKDIETKEEHLGNRLLSIGTRNNKIAIKIFATMSAGKSTVINALLRQKLMPSSNMACTAKITKITDNDGEFSVVAFNKDGDVVADIDSDVNYGTMQVLNEDDTIDYVEIAGNIPFSDANNVKISLIDTPGPNNSRDTNHKEFMEQELSDLSDNIVVYVINATQFGVNDDARLLDELQSKLSNDTKVIFLVNKVDQFDPEEENIPDLLDSVKKYLEAHKFNDPKIYPISALAALNIRTLLQDPDIDEDDDEIYETSGLVRKLNRNADFHFEKYAPVSEKVAEKLALELHEAEDAVDKAGQALIHSGIRSVEEAILEMTKEPAYYLEDDFWE
ncbi:MAG: dynamin family protein [Ligilactobacillus animalis]|uniref:dynamin family protein n=1 Tax=Ligilactobacillus animalis TaxID=1605 RepID=UPI00242B2792|nr:dynamin family protein [Ligilactobacillus animalis]MCI5941526.1 dynamin family protein [Ligilactobacillus animalis]MDY2994113.1 dynamin family protein [Ligilactobacillus animalis]